MTTTITLRAWGRPMEQNYNPAFQTLDHTWITNIPLNIATEKPSGFTGTLDISNGSAGIKSSERFWYCRGEKHLTASKPLGAAPGTAEIADNISPLNAPPSMLGKDAHDPSYNSGSVVYYGLDGVSHNIANQVLCATGTAIAEPLRVQDAKGYVLSTFFFSTYGLADRRWAQIAADNLEGIKLAGDDFLPFMNAVVPAHKQEQLLKLRADLHADLRRLRESANSTSGYDYFPKLFKLALKYLSLAELRLGTHMFETLFSKTASRDVSWLHPEGELSPAALNALSAIEASPH